MTETIDWNSGQGAYPSDRNEWTLRMEPLPPAEPTEVTRHLSARPTLDEIRSLCDDEMGNVDGEVRCKWRLEDPDGNDSIGYLTLKPTSGAA